METQLTRHKSDVLIGPKCVVLQLEFTTLPNIHAVSLPSPPASVFDGEASADLLLFDFPLHLEFYYNYIEFQSSGISTGSPCFLFVLAGPKIIYLPLCKCCEVIIQCCPRSPVSAGCYLSKLSLFSKKKVLSFLRSKHIPRNNNIIPTIFFFPPLLLCFVAHGVSSQKLPPLRQTA